MSSDFLPGHLNSGSRKNAATVLLEMHVPGLPPAWMIRHDSYEFGCGVSLCKVRMLHLVLDANELARDVWQIVDPCPTSLWLALRCRANKLQKSVV